MTPIPEVRDPLLEVAVLLRDAKIKIATAINVLSDELRRQDEMFQRIMAEVRANDEAVTGMGTTGPTLGTPCSDPAPGLETRTHAFCELRASGGICADDDPPGRDA